MRKVTDIATLFFIAGLVFTGLVFGQLPKANDREMAPHKGIARSVIDVPGYTYVELEEKGGRIWIAAPKMHVEEGDRVWASRGMEMRDHYSKTLDRTFPVIIFVGRAEAEGKGSEDAKKIEMAHSKVKKSIDRPKTSSSPAKGSIARAKGGYTLEELFGKKDKLAGKEVVVRGKIVKAAGKIMGKRWYHLQDGSDSGDDILDLVLTSDNDAGAGDIVLVTGVLELGKDFGQGYKYDVIIEDAEIKVE